MNCRGAVIPVCFFLIHSLIPTPLQKVCIYSVGWDIRCRYGRLTVAVITKTRHCPHPWASSIYRTFSRPVSLRYIVASPIYEGHLENKERFAIQSYLLIIEKKQNMQVLWHTFTYFSTSDIEALVVPWHQFTYSLLVPDGRLAIHRVALISQCHEHLFAHS